MERYRKEIEECTTTYCWSAYMQVFGTKVQFTIHKTNSEYRLVGSFEETYHMHANQFKVFPTTNSKNVSFFDKKGYDSFDNVLLEYNKLVYAVQSRDAFQIFQKAFILDNQDDGNIILCECKVCFTDDFADQRCHTCGFAVCQFCLYKLSYLSNEYSCPQCKAKYEYEDYEKY